jgi:DNA-binding transcriptional regulator YdaS (Cro superfamily)
MRLQDALSHFGTQQKLAEALNIKQGSISSWDRDRIPLARALQVERLTQGRVKVDMTIYVKSRRAPAQ